MKLTTLLTPFAGRSVLRALFVLGLALGFQAAPAYAQSAADGGAQAVLDQSAAPTVADAVCEPCLPKGCVHTQGYWGNKPNVNWPIPHNRNAMFFSSGLSWQQVLDAPVQGSGYLILAKQYIAAVLNIASGATAPVAILQIISNANIYFLGGTTPASCAPGACETQKGWAATLETYNSGQYPNAPKACPD